MSASPWRPSRHRQPRSSPRWPRSGLAPRHPSNSLTTAAVGGWHGITGKISGAIGIEPVVFPMDMFTTVPGSNIHYADWRGPLRAEVIHSERSARLASRRHLRYRAPRRAWVVSGALAVRRRHGDLSPSPTLQLCNRLPAAVI